MTLKIGKLIISKPALKGKLIAEIFVRESHFHSTNPFYAIAYREPMRDQQDSIIGFYLSATDNKNKKYNHRTEKLKFIYFIMTNNYNSTKSLEDIIGFAEKTIYINATWREIASWPDLLWEEKYDCLIKEVNGARKPEFL